MSLSFSLCLSCCNSDVAFKVQVVTPTGNVLVDDLTLKVKSGSNLLITGSYLNSLFGGLSFKFHFLSLFGSYIALSDLLLTFLLRKP